MLPGSVWPKNEKTIANQLTNMLMLVKANMREFPGTRSRKQQESVQKHLEKYHQINSERSRFITKNVHVVCGDIQRYPEDKHGSNGGV